MRDVVRPGRSFGFDMNAGREHAERRAAQAAAARKHVNKARSHKRPGKGNRNHESEFEVSEA